MRCPRGNGTLGLLGTFGPLGGIIDSRPRLVDRNASRCASNGDRDQSVLANAVHAPCHPDAATKR